MGLDTSHNCWHGSYSAFNRWRTKLCEVAGYGALEMREGFGGDVPWPEDDILVELLSHQDCEGDLKHEICGALADRLESLMPALKIAGNGGGHIQEYSAKTQTFIDGLRLAASLKEDVDFH